MEKEYFVSTGRAILAINPDAKISVSTPNDGSADIINWGDTPVISQADIDSKIVELESVWIATQYQRDRQYPALGEQLDLLFHDMTAGKGTKSGEWYKAIKKVKADNPKG